MYILCCFLSEERMNNKLEAEKMGTKTVVIIIALSAGTVAGLASPQNDFDGHRISID